MPKEIKCPKCGSHKVRSYDNQPLYHAPTSEDVEKTFGYPCYDNEIYISFVCDSDGCGNQFELTLEINQ